MERLRLASRNEHKLRELQNALPGWDLALLDAEYPPETGATYYDNARRKARFGHTIEEGTWILGEDSGLEVDGLGGGPGISSSRFAPDEDFVGRLLAALEGVEGSGRRRARYVCELVALSPEGDEFRGTGALVGTIAPEPLGSEGFGYDPVFVPEGETRTVAELGNDWKAAHSHRARAARALREAVRSA